MKKLISMSLAIFLIFTLNPAAFADAYDPLRTQVDRNGDNLLEYVVEDGAVEINSYVAIMPPAVTSADQSRSGKWQWCTGLSDPICDPTKSPESMKATSILPPCVDATSENCIDSLEIGNANQMVQAKLIRSTKGITFPADSKYNFLGGSTTSLWDAPGVPSSSGLTTYSVMPRVQSYFRGNKFELNDFFVSVIPYKEESGNYQENRINPDPNASATDRYLGNSSQMCAWAEAGVCGRPQDFAPGTKIKLKIRLSKDIGGWFRGRITDPSMSVTNFSSTNNLITVQASPVTVPRMAFINKISSFTPQEKVWYENFGGWPLELGGSSTGPQAGNPNDSFPFIDLYRSRVKDTAQGINTFWNFTTTSWGNGSQCLQDKSKVLGIVTTNAMAYDGSSPSFEDGTLNYHVSGLHYMPDGTTPVQGTYNLVMRSDTARCLYGFTSAPIKATISIVGAENSPIATVVTGEKDGWLSLSANGFTFSQKTLQVKLSQDAPAKVAAPVKAITKSITCIKGKVSKVVSTATCPAGYKKKV